MKTNSLKILTAVVVGLFVLGASMRVDAQGPTLTAKEITAEEAAKKYPPPKGGYPEGQASKTSTGGFFASPYGASRVYDCRKIKKGAMILDESANKIFLRP